jgi:D-alanyl-lipoteichoic acid acyltransferase DltB (MBOAT superfamily)
MGFRITENFAAPYAAVSITDFWRRWHVSLSTWLRDYIYIPLGGNRKGRFRKCLNILITFLVSGLWHGADWSFIFWGLLHGLYLVAENIFRPLIRRMNRTFHIPTASSGYLICRRAYTFVLVGFAWIFFRADSMHQAVRYISRMFSQPDWWILNTDQVFQYGLSAQEMWIAGAALLLLLFMDAVRVRKGMMPDAWLDSQWVVFRVLFVGFLAVSTIVFGIYGPGFHSGDFIYMKF